MNITRTNANAAVLGITPGGEVLILGLRHRGPFKVISTCGAWVEIENPVTERRGEMHCDELTAVDR